MFLNISLTISETAKSIQCWHFDDKRKDVINESVESLVGEHSPREVGYRFEFVVDEELWGHHDETLTRNKPHVRPYCDLFIKHCVHWC